MNDIKLPINLAVYGTLKKGYGNHYLIKECPFMGEILLPNMRCYMGSSFPMAWYDLTSEQSLKCELYNIVSPKVLEQLHSLEGHPDFFKCVKHPSMWVASNDSQRMDIWFYQCQEAYGAKTSLDSVMEWSRT